jgi:hypothetical protein
MGTESISIKTEQDSLELHDLQTSRQQQEEPSQQSKINNKTFISGVKDSMVHTSSPLIELFHDRDQTHETTTTEAPSYPSVKWQQNQETDKTSSAFRDNTGSLDADRKCLLSLTSSQGNSGSNSNNNKKGSLVLHQEQLLDQQVNRLINPTDNNNSLFYRRNHPCIDRNSSSSSSSSCDKSVDLNTEMVTSGLQMVSSPPSTTTQQNNSQQTHPPMASSPNHQNQSQQNSSMTSPSPLSPSLGMNTQSGNNTPSSSSFIIVDPSGCHSLGSPHSLSLNDQVNTNNSSSGNTSSNIGPSGANNTNLSYEQKGNQQQPQQVHLQPSFVVGAGHHQPIHPYSLVLNQSNSNLNSSSHQQSIQQHSPSSSSANSNLISNHNSQQPQQPQSHQLRSHDQSSNSSLGSSPTIHSSSTSLSLTSNPYQSHPPPLLPPVNHQINNNSSGSSNNNNNNNNMYTSADYLAQLLKDQKQVAAFPGVFFHLERLLNEGQSGKEETLFFVVVVLLLRLFFFIFFESIFHLLLMIFEMRSILKLVCPVSRCITTL